MCCSPRRLELSRPLADQLTLQRPPLLIGQVGHSDLQHYLPSTCWPETPTSEAASVNLLDLRNRLHPRAQFVTAPLPKSYSSELPRITSTDDLCSPTVRETTVQSI